MARVTVEDCIETVPDRFDLVLLAARRAKQIATGGELTVDRDNDKDSVVSLREIAGGTVDPAALTEDLIYSFSKRRFHEPRLDDAALEDGSTDDVKEIMKADSKRVSSVAMDDSEDLLSDEDPASAKGMAFGDDDIDIAD